ncbi:YciI family protein [Massilia sp. TS11]|uniref:YciI family protein n=1 Tax=Massilia sp. TS11 TaxID=2908003 RepID=UPI001EDC2546|nr:YciI family protein [Massilia sp. TS11]MCG2585611.1 YciI family protein [Massilia sp. TS11]
MFVIVLHYIQPLDQVTVQLEAHRAYLDRHYAAGNFIASGPQNPRTGGIILARAMARTELDQLLTEDPFHQHDVARYEVIEFTPNKFAPGVESVLAWPAPR